MTDDYSADRNTTGRFGDSGPITGQIEAAGDSDWFALPVTRGQRYQILLGVMNGGTTDNVQLAVHRPNGNQLGRLDNSSRIAFTAPTTGTYYIAVKGKTGVAAPLDYTVQSFNGSTPSWDDAAGDASTAVPFWENQAAGYIERAGDVDWIRATITERGNYRLRVSTPDIQFNVRATLVNAQGRAVTGTLSPGTYYARVAAPASSPTRIGEYLVTLEKSGARALSGGLTGAVRSRAEGAPSLTLLAAG